MVQLLWLRDEPLQSELYSGYERILNSGIRHRTDTLSFHDCDLRHDHKPRVCARNVAYLSHLPIASDHQWRDLYAINQVRWLRKCRWHSLEYFPGLDFPGLVSSRLYQQPKDERFVCSMDNI